MYGGVGDRLDPTHSTTSSVNTKQLTDPRLQGLDITKWEFNKKIRDRDGKIIENINIHYLKDNKTGERFDFKFKGN
jgi:predicted double-glycine peptidase